MAGAPEQETLPPICFLGEAVWTEAGVLGGNRVDIVHVNLAPQRLVPAALGGSLRSVFNGQGSPCVYSDSACHSLLGSDAYALPPAASKPLALRAREQDGYTVSTRVGHQQ